jgi:hypothetical protein
MCEDLAGTLEGKTPLEYLGIQQVTLKRILEKQDVRV